MSVTLTCNQCGYEAEYDDEEQASENGWWQDDDGYWYCSDCHDYCRYCDSEMPNRNLEFSENIDGSVCDDCRDEHCFRCGICEQLDDNSERCEVFNTFEGRIMLICQNCFDNAQEQGRLRRASNGVYEYTPRADDHPENSVQFNLHPEIWKEINECPDCNSSRDKCPKCLRKMAKEIEEEETHLWQYDTMPRSYHNSLHEHFKSTKLRKAHEHPYLYYGIELETLFRSREPIEKIAKEFLEATGGLFVAEFDRSVSEAGNGIEFISRALSLPMWLDESTYQLLQAGKKVLDKYGAYNPQPDTCGLHVHMSLKFFEKNTTKKVKEIKSDIDWIFQIFQTEIEKFSRRKYTKFCTSKAWRAKEIMRNMRYNELGFNLSPRIEISKGELTISQGAGPTHHDAIIQTQRTIEVRTFKSTIIPEEILATIEFCRAIAHAARNMELNKKTTLGNIIWCKDSKYLPEMVKKTKLDTTKTFNNKLEVKI